jgi:hypothetical protein
MDPLGQKKRRGHPPLHPLQQCTIALYNQDAAPRPPGASGIDQMCGAANTVGPADSEPMPTGPDLDPFLATLTNDNSCCIKNLWLFDRGTHDGQQQLHGETLTASDISVICRYLCEGATINLTACWAGQTIPTRPKIGCVGPTGKPCAGITPKGGQKPSTQLILENCRKVTAVTGCTGCYNVPPVGNRGTPDCPENCPPGLGKPSCGGDLNTFYRVSGNNL